MFLRHLWPAILCALVILILCVTPGQTLPEVGIINFDKFVHSAMFAGLTFLVARGFYKQTRFAFLQQHFLLNAFFLCTFYGGLLEILQATVCINRSGDWLDFFFDGLGALATIGLFKFNRSLLLG
ncbi:MAG: VanZ family protein [Methylococcaceae bacterium]|jgi:VanZ family protein